LRSDTAEFETTGKSSKAIAFFAFSINNRTIVGYFLLAIKKKSG